MRRWRMEVIVTASSAVSPQLQRARNILDELLPTAPDIDAEVGIKNGEAYMVIRARDESHVAPGWTVIRTPGARWYSLELGEDHEHDVVDEDATTDEVRGYLRRYVEVATAYLRGDYEVTRSRWLRTPILVVHLGDEQVRVDAKLGWEFTRLARRRARD